jgi:hypothetical protein
MAVPVTLPAGGGLAEAGTLAPGYALTSKEANPTRRLNPSQELKNSMVWRRQHNVVRLCLLRGIVSNRSTLIVPARSFEVLLEKAGLRLAPLLDALWMSVGQ